MSTLVLPLKGEFFNAIRNGSKTEEYRLRNDYWRKRLEGREYGHIELTHGYPARQDTSRRLILPWRGYTIKTLQHPLFGPEPVEVFAIRVGAQP